MIIDAYAHCGQDKFLPVESVRECMLAAGVDRAVLCQHLGQTDNRYIAECVRSNPSVFAGVALIDSARVDWPVALAAVADEALFRGVRMTTAMLLGNRDFAYAAMDRGLHVVLYAPDGVDDVIDVVMRAPTGRHAGRVVITHLGSPVFADGRLARGSRLLDCAAADQAMVTLSGLGMYTQYPHAVAQSFVRDVVSAFGADRVMWGSNFPVLGGTTAYMEDLGLLLQNAWGLPETAIAPISGQTAEAVWFTTSVVQPSR